MSSVNNNNFIEPIENQQEKPKKPKQLPDTIIGKIGSYLDGEDSTQLMDSFYSKPRLKA